MAWVPQRPAVWAFVAGAALVAVRVLRSDGEWLTVYVSTAQALLRGQDIYQQPFGYTYPPFASLLGIPFVGLGVLPGRFLWFVVNVAASAITLRLAWRLADGGPLRRGATRPGDAQSACLGLIAGAPFLLNALVHQQTDVVVSALLLSGVVSFRQSAYLRGAVLAGLAAAIKGPALIFLPYLFWCRRITGGLLVITVAVTASLLPDLVHRPTSGHAVWLGQWVDRYITPMTQGTYAIGTWASDPLYNQSVAGAIHRWTHTTWDSTAGHLGVTRRATTPTTRTTRAAWAAVMVLVVAVMIGALAIGRRRNPCWSRRAPWECALVLSAMLLGSPMSSPAHFGVLLLPGFLLARVVCRTPGSPLTPALVVMVVAGAMANKDLVGEFLYTMQLWLGLTMWSAVAALCGCALALARVSPASECRSPRGGATRDAQVSAEGCGQSQSPIPALQPAHYR